MSCSDASPASTVIGLRDLLVRLGDELCAMAGDIERLQDALSGPLTATRPSAELLLRSQALDHVRQHMAELGSIVGRVADDTPAGSQVKASVLADVSLAALVERLAGAAPTPSVSGEMEMF